MKPELTYNDLLILLKKKNERIESLKAEIKKKSIPYQHKIDVISNLRKKIDALLDENKSLRKSNIGIDLIKSINTNDDLLLNIKLYVDYIFGFDIAIRSRKGDLPEARAFFYYFAKRYTSKSLKIIGSYVGNVDHSTVINGLKYIDDKKDLYKGRLAKQLMDMDAYILDTIINGNKV